MSAGKIRKVVITWAGWKELILSRARSDGFESLNIVALDDRQEILAAVRDADALVVGALDAQILDSAKQVMWIHAMAGGVGPYLFPEFVRSPVLFTCCKPCFGIVGAEYALGAMLLFSRRSHTAMGSPFLSQWMVAQDEVLSPFELSGKTLGIIGLGNMGQALAQRAGCLGISVLGTARKARAATDWVEQTFAFEDRCTLLKRSDFVVIAIPLTPEARGFFGEPELQSMKETAYLIDCSGRPPLFDYPALETALRDGVIGGACLQPSGEQPGVPIPPSDSTFWELDNVIVTPCRATSREQEEACIELFFANLGRYERGQSLEGAVDKEAGY